jgi:hypothetical protein
MKGAGGFGAMISLSAGMSDGTSARFSTDARRSAAFALDRIISAAKRIVDRSEGPLRSDYAAYAVTSPRGPAPAIGDPVDD